MQALLIDEKFINNLLLDVLELSQIHGTIVSSCHIIGFLFYLCGSYHDYIATKHQNSYSAVNLLAASHRLQG